MTNGIETAGRTPLVGASALHGVSGHHRWSRPASPGFAALAIAPRPEATWAQPLGPGRAVLTRGVSRRSGSVACIHADASPTEVLAESIVTPRPGPVKLIDTERGAATGLPAPAQAARLRSPT